MPESKIGYDELLQARVRQLKEIQDRIGYAIKRFCRNPTADMHDGLCLLNSLRTDIGVMIERAECKHTNF